VKSYIQNNVQFKECEERAKKQANPEFECANSNKKVNKEKYDC